MNEVFNTSAASATVLPTTCYLAWSTVIPPDDGVGTGFTEPTTITGYARVEMTGLTNAVNGMVSNGAILSYTESIADQGIAKAYGVYDALTGGNLLIFNALTKSKTIEEGTTLSIKPTELKFTLEGM